MLIYNLYIHKYVYLLIIGDIYIYNVQIYIYIYIFIYSSKSIYLYFLSLISTLYAYLLLE